MKGFVSSRLHPILTLLLLVVLVVAGACVGLFVVVVFCRLVYGLGFGDAQRIMALPANSPNGWAIFMLAQGSMAYFGFAGGALLLPRLQGQPIGAYFQTRRPVPLLWPLVAAALILASLPLMSAIIDWNTHLHLPGFLSEQEAKMRADEAHLQKLTKFITNFTSPGRFLGALVVVAAGAAIGEELVFRGVVQRQLIRWFNSPHVGIWLAAIVFSAVHNQFLGFFPRMILGLGLGYLYLWSGNIWVSIAAHFTQNAFQLALLYNQQLQWSSPGFDPDSTESMPWYWVLASLVACAGLLWYLYRQMHNAPAEALPTQMHTLGSQGVAVRHAEQTPPAARTLSHDGVDATKANR